MDPPTNATESGTQQVTATITDDDAQPTVAFNATTSSASEATTSVTLPVSLSASSFQTVTVQYSVTGGTATGGGVDYTLAAGTLTFNPGTTTLNVPITVVNDTLDENDETIVVTLCESVERVAGDEHRTHLHNHRQRRVADRHARPQREPDGRGGGWRNG